MNVSVPTGQYDVWDIFASRPAGSVKLTAVFQPSQEGAQCNTAEATAVVRPDEEEQELLRKLTELSHHADAMQSPAGACGSCKLCVCM